MMDIGVFLLIAIMLFALYDDVMRNNHTKIVYKAPSTVRKYKKVKKLRIDR